MPAERSSTIIILAIAGVILFLILGSIFWVHRVDTAPKVPLHSVNRPLLLPGGVRAWRV